MACPSMLSFGMVAFAVVRARLRRRGEDGFRRPSFHFSLPDVRLSGWKKFNTSASI